MISMDAGNAVIKSFALVHHPEGGFYKETYRASLELNGLPADFSGPRASSTAIYYLLPSGPKSAFHRIRSDEVWHFDEGGPLKIVEVDPDSGRVHETILGPPSQGGQTYQHVVPANRWFGALPVPRVSYSFVGCTLAPGFDFAHFELAKKEEFLERYPDTERYRSLLP